MTPRTVRIAYWVIAVFLGSVQTWFTRHRIFSDGISYLNIAQQYAGGDWHGALNAYWSPLFSWLIAAYLELFRPSTYWQSAGLHLISFIAFLASCWVYEKFLRDLIALRPVGFMGLSPRTLEIAGYVAILHGGLLMVGMGYVSPDMIAFFLTGLAAWLMVRLAVRPGAVYLAAALGVTLGVAYLARAAYAPLSFIYLVATAIWLTRKPSQLLICAVCALAIAAPFMVAISLKRGAWTIGEASELNYGWEVNRAARWTHWQGEPGDIGTPLHPTRLILKQPVPVYEFAEPVKGSYPPWQDPSYWYDGIRPHLDLAKQIKILALNAVATGFYIATSPILWILIGLAAVTKGRAVQPWKWPSAYCALAIPAIAGMGMYCLVFSEKRYIAGFFLVLLVTALAGVSLSKAGPMVSRWADTGVQSICALFVLVMFAWLVPQIALAAGDLAHGHESETNVSWALAHKFAEIGVKPGDTVAYVGSGFEADWVRIAGAKIVAEVPVIHNRGAGVKRLEDTDESYKDRFFSLQPAEREKVYTAFRQAGAVIAVTNRIPRGGEQCDWIRVLDPADPLYPKGAGQVLLQSPAYYRWLNR